MRLTSPSNTEEGEERAAGFVLFRTFHSQTQYLLLRHNQNDGHWGFPKGRLDPGESEMEAAIRETREETGIGELVPVPEFRGTSNYVVNRDGHQVAKTVVYFLAEAKQSDVCLSAEHQAFQWLPYEQAMGVLTYEESRQILVAAQSLLDKLALSRE